MNSTRTAISIFIASATLISTLGDSNPTAGRLNAQSPIVLRDLSLVRDKTITKFDENSIHLSDGSELGWDQVLKASVAPQRQAAFDTNLEQIGLPLFRLKSRIANEDWIGAGEIAKPIYESRFDDVRLRQVSAHDARFEIESEYLVCLATMNCYIAQGTMAKALMPFFRAAAIQSHVSDEIRDIVGSKKIPERDRELMFSRDIMPIWFERSEIEQAARQLADSIKPRLSEKLAPATTEIGERPQLGEKLYLASLRIEQGQTGQGLDLLRSLNLDDDAELSSWRSVLEARVKQKTNNQVGAQVILDANQKSMSGSARPAALYLRGINVLIQSEPTDTEYAKAMLTLLRIPAIYGEQHPELSAAALFQSAVIAERRERDSDAQKLRDELLRRYTGTYHGRLEQERRAGHEGPEFE